MPLVRRDPLRESLLEVPAEEKDVIAGLLSFVPGLGHIYKGRLLIGFSLLLFGMPTALWISLLLAPATLGLSLMIPVAFWLAVIVNAVVIDPWNR